MNRRMCLLFSHILTEEQEQEGREILGVNEFLSLPAEFQAIWRDVPPEVETLHEYLQPIFAWIGKNARDGDYAFVSGDFGATYLVVAYCFSKGIVPIYATTRRYLREERKGDVVVSIREFRHERFREYGK